MESEFGMDKTLINPYLFVAFALICGGCESLQSIIKVERPVARLQAVRLDGISPESAGLLFDVEIQNPYPVDLPLLDMTYAVATGGNKLFDGKADIQKAIPARAKATVILPAKIAYLDMINALKSFTPGSNIPYQANVGLSFDAPALGIVNVPVSHTGELAVPKIADINWQNLLHKSPKTP